jgi:hypothetical protein
MSIHMTKTKTDQTKHNAEAAKRALAEAKERKENQKPLDLPTELGGRDGPEPTRFGDWERKGIATDF